MTRFSRRFRWDLTPNRLSQLLKEKKGEFLDLTVTNPTRFFPAPTWELMPALTYDPDSRGLLETRCAVARYYATKGVQVDPAHIFLTTSTSEAYAWIFKLLCDPGDEILVPRPSYPLFEFLAGMELVETHPYPLNVPDPDHWIAERTRAMVFVHPNNPTGEYVSSPLPTRIPAIVDEVFLDYWFHSPRASFAGRKDGLTFTLSGLSKVCALPQMKLGWIVVSGPAPDCAAVCEKLELIADTYLPVSTPIQLQAISWLKQVSKLQAPIRERTLENRNLLDVKPEGGWTGLVALPESTNEEDFVLSLLEEDSVLAQPGYFYDFVDTPKVVLSLLTDPKDFARGLEAILSRTK